MSNQDKTKTQTGSGINELSEKLSEEESNLVSHHLSKLIDNISGGIIITTREGEILHVNQEFREMFNINSTTATILHSDYRELICQIKRLFNEEDKFVSGIDKILNAGKPVLNEKLGLVDGRVFERDYVPIEITENHVENLWHYRDITDRQALELALVESEEKYRSIVENTQDLIMLTDPEGKIFYLSPACKVILGYEPEELLGRQPWIIHPDDLEKVKRNHFKALKGESNRDFVYRIKTKNSQAKWVCHSWSPIFKPNSKKLKMIVSVVQDITKQKEEKKALQESEKQYRTLAEAAQDAIYIIDREDKISFLNSFAAKLFGKTPQEIIGKPRNEMFPPHISEQQYKVLRHVFESGEIVQQESKAIFEDKEVWLITKLIPLKSETGEINSILGVSHDITKRKKAEEILRQSEEKYRGIFDESIAAIYLFDANKNFIDSNQAGLDLLGYSREELMKMSIPQVDEDPETVLPAHGNLLSGERIVNYEHKLRRKDGKIITVLNNSRPITDGDGNVVGIQSTLIDITARKQAEEEKMALETQLLHSQKMEIIGTLTGGIAHDFNNILTPIIGYTDMALTNLPPTDPLRKDLEQVLKGAYLAKDLIEQILLFSKQTEKILVPLYLQNLVEESLKLLRPSIPATIEIKQKIDTSCGMVLANATQIHQVIANLCTNAWQTMEEKGGTLTIELKQVKVNAAIAKIRPNLHETEYARLSVTDTGEGMDKKILDRIFEPFFTTKPVNKGSGLGLSVVHGIVLNHKGDIWVESEPGKGSTFHVYIPINKTGMKIEEPRSKTILKGQESILVVDDNEVVANLMKKMLEKLGYNVNIYINSIDALKAFQQNPKKYDLLISDLTMPNMTGVDLSERLQKIRPGFPIIIMTGYGELLDKETRENYGIKKIVGKPIVMSELAPLIREVLDE